MGDLGRYLAFWPMPRGRANRCIDAGDLARNAGAWDDAAFHYRRAVTIQPRRRPIWVQLGHAEKEAGRPKAALEAYARASLLPGDDGEAALHHGLQAKALGLHALAKASFERAFRENPSNPGARGEWQVMLHHPLAASEEDKVVAADLLRADQARCEATASKGVLIFDVTDLLQHFRNARLPTGVQRVQMEVVCAAIPLHAGLRICCFTGLGDGWVLIPVEQFQSICALALADSDMFAADWIRAVEIMAATVALAAPVGFAPGDTLVNLGTSWILPNYFLHIRHIKRAYGIRYIPFVHDLIPVLAPQYCLPDVVHDYLAWIGGIFDHADRYLTNSCSTAADLTRVAHLLARDVGKHDIAVIPLDTATPSYGRKPLEVSELSRWGLSSLDYVLFVSSIEPRKNHLMALRAWQILSASKRGDAPDLICVGGGGWLNEPIHAMINQDPVLAEKVKILSEISDDELALLYRHCRFTIYPSHYEGWGMPVTEALCHGKVPIVSRCSSLTEAGGHFAVYVEPNDAAGLAKAVDELWCNTDQLAALEHRIKQEFHPRSWQDVAVQTITMCQSQDLATVQEVPSLRQDALYRLGRQQNRHLVPGAHKGEMIRHGLGWEAPEDGQCRTSSQGGELVFQVESNPSSVACHLRLVGAGQVTNMSKLAHQQDQSGWLSYEVPVLNGSVTLKLSGGASLSHLLISDSADLRQVAARITKRKSSDYAFLKDIFPLVLGREADPENLAEFLPSLEAGGITRADVLATLYGKAGWA